ncbi:hypothetical protein MLD38_002603 [Melastoma candidum]|uniref:Uncharacterized protein n=1 Tax=Melastoma candidum TaxID=119954 RepID=A0ACB9S1U2_9MYRT|nr:hypothetical protein MLD38_002603 [Melastoma candidum]
MKKLFFFRSSAPSNSNNVPEPSEKKGSAGNSRLAGGDVDKYENNYQSPRRSFSNYRQQDSDSWSACNQSGSALRRSRSLTSATFLGDGFEHGNPSNLNDLNRSPSRQSYRHPISDQKSIPERQSKGKQFEDGAPRNGRGSNKSGSAGSPKPDYDSSGHSSNSSSYTSNKVVDRYIDGEQHQDKGKPKRSCPKIYAVKESGVPSSRAQYTAPSSPTDYCNSKSKSRSFRDAKGSCHNFSSGEWEKSSIGHNSPRTLAKNVMERLSQTTTFPKSSFHDFDSDIPITIQDVYCGSSDKCFDQNSDVGTPKSIPFSEPNGTTKRNHRKDISCIHKEGGLRSRKCEAFGSDDSKDDVDLALQARHKEAKARVVHFSEELLDDCLSPDFSFDVPTIMRTVRNLSEDRISLAAEVVELLQSRIKDRSSVKEELRRTKAESQLQARRLEKEKKEQQQSLEKELDRRSSDWSSKLEKIQREEQRLRERVRELAEQNVQLQREVCSINERELESRNFISCSERQITEMKVRAEQFSQKNQDLQRNLSDIKEKYQAAVETSELSRRTFLEKEKECKELHKSLARLLRTCTDQQKTIEGLRQGLDDSGRNGQSRGTGDDTMLKLRTELVRLTGVDLSLRKELEVNRQEVEALRRENISLLGRLKGNTEDYGASFFCVNKEMHARVGCLQSDALSTLNQSTDLCSKVLDFVKSRTQQHESTTREGIEAIQRSLDGQFIVEADMKLQGLKRKTESLTISFQTMSTLLQEKAKIPLLKSQQQEATQDRSPKISTRTSSEDLWEAELKAERLMTQLLKGKLYTKELEAEQLQAELATAVRAADCIKFEVQNAMDNLSSITHKSKELELQMQKKDEKIVTLEIQLDESRRELGMMRGVLPNVSEQRDRLLEDNMLLNLELQTLKKKVDDLDEVVHEKEGQISILRDTLRNEPFNLLDGPDLSSEQFLVR